MKIKVTKYHNVPDGPRCEDGNTTCNFWDDYFCALFIKALDDGNRKCKECLDSEVKE